MYLLQALWSPQTGSDLTGAWRRDASMRPSRRNRHTSRSLARQRDQRRFGRQQRCDREVAVDMLPCCRRGAGVAGAARRDHDGYSDTPGRPVLPDGGTLPRLAHAEKNSETACSRVTDESVRVTPRVSYRSHRDPLLLLLDTAAGSGTFSRHASAVLMIELLARFGAGSTGGHGK